MAAGAGRLSAAPKKVLELSNLRGHGVLASSRVGVVASTKVLAPSGGEVLAVLRVIVVGERLEEHRRDVGPAIGIEVGARCLAEAANVDGVGRKGHVRFGLRVVVVPLKLEVAAAPGALLGKRLRSDDGFVAGARGLARGGRRGRGCGGLGVGVGAGVGAGAGRE